MAGALPVKKAPPEVDGDKPNSVRRRRRRDDHFSERLIPGSILRIAPAERVGDPAPCFVLHRMGFFVPRRLRSGRWALTPPFHPCPRRAASLSRSRIVVGGLFSVTLSVASGFRQMRPRVLRGMLPVGVRTFLPRSISAARAIICHPRAGYYLLLHLATAQTPMSSFQSVGFARMNSSISAMHPGSFSTSTRTPWLRTCASGPWNVLFSPTTSRGMP
jgi:hypothetical protein